MPVFNIPVILNEVKELVCGRKNKRVGLKKEEKLGRKMKLVFCDLHVEKQRG